MLIYDENKVVLNYLDIFKDKNVKMSPLYFSDDGNFVCLLHTFVKLTGDPTLCSWFGNMLKASVDLPAVAASAARKSAFEKALNGAGIPCPNMTRSRWTRSLSPRCCSWRARR